MCKYATSQLFAGQRASVGRNVVVSLRGRIRAGVIDEIISNEPVIALHDGATAPPTLTFVATTSVGDVDSMPEGSWTWPVRI